MSIAPTELIDTELIEDPEPGLRRRCLPIDDYLQATVPLSAGAVPLSGLEYLRQVRHEAQFRCAAVVVAKRPMSATTESTAKRPRHEMFSLDNAAQHFPLPQTLCVSEKDAQNVAAEFIELRKRFLALKATNKDFKTVAVPSVNQSDDVWKRFCYPDLPASQSPSAQPTLTATSHIMPTSLTTTPWLPLFPILIHIDHNRAIHLLRLHIKWIYSTSTIIPLQLHWAFMLLLCLDTPLFPEQSSILRDLVRKCKSVRNQWISAQDSHLSLQNDGIMGIHAIIAVVSRVFGQADLMDPVKENSADTSSAFVIAAAAGFNRLDSEDCDDMEEDGDLGEDEDGELDESGLMRQDDIELTEILEQSQMLGDERYF
ncbi:gem (nuclear organelle) associated protein 2 [Rhizoclosmatium sp. JEL0117]|nr:gem (nuclear organelle) associated protein 2 [Rhizoclosmatium sp. JEL0117]